MGSGMIMSKPSDKINFFIVVLAVFMLLLFKTSHVLAGPVYKSVDAEGNVTYSSTPPKEATQSEKMNITSKGHSSSAKQDNTNIEQIKNLAGEMEKDRKQRQDDRTAADKKREEAQAKKAAEDAKRQAENQPEPEVRYYPVYVPRRYRPGHHPNRPNRPRPEPRTQPR